MPVLRKTYLWDPLEPAVTRILAMSLFDETGTCAEDLYYTHDLLKNTTALFGIRAGRRALYEYGPYGNIVRINIDYIGLTSQDVVGPIDYDLEDPPPGKKKCYGFLEQSPKKQSKEFEKNKLINYNLLLKRQIELRINWGDDVI